MIRTFLLVLLILAAVPVFAQDQTGGLSGGYMLNGAEDDLAITRVTIAGTGSIYIVGSEGSRATKPLLAEGAVAVWAAGQHTACNPGLMLRQHDGTLFGLWIDKDVSPTALGLEYYHPQSETSDFAGTYDIIGSYSDGAQYRGTLTIVQHEQGSYTLRWAFTSDEQHPGDVPFSETGIGTTRRSILGYTFGDEGVQCSAAVAEFNDSGFDASFVGIDGHVVGFTGTRQP